MKCTAIIKLNSFMVGGWYVYVCVHVCVCVCELNTAQDGRACGEWKMGKTEGQSDVEFNK